MLLQLLASPQNETVNVLAWLHNGSKQPKGMFIIYSRQIQCQAELHTHLCAIVQTVPFALRFIGQQ